MIHRSNNLPNCRAGLQEAPKNFGISPIGDRSPAGLIRSGRARLRPSFFSALAWTEPGTSGENVSLCPAKSIIIVPWSLAT